MENISWKSHVKVVMARPYIEHKTVPMIKSAVTGLILLVTVVITGTIGYMLIESYTIIDALYMTIITMATVGFREIAVLSDFGKLFTIFLILGSFGIFGYVVTMVTRFVVDGVFTHFYKDNKVKKKIDRLKNHVVICGFGRNGKQAAMSLRRWRSKRCTARSASSADSSACHARRCTKREKSPAQCLRSTSQRTKLNTKRCV